MPEGKIAPDLRALIRDVPDFPQPGIVYKDITPLIADASAFEEAIERMIAPFSGERITKVAAPESRGFIFGAAIARAVNAGFVPIRKPGRLPWQTRRMDYKLEYGTDAIEIHGDAVCRDDRVLLVDDVLATGGTAAASAALLEMFEAQVVGASFLIELTFLDGRSRLAPRAVHAVLST